MAVTAATVTEEMVATVVATVVTTAEEMVATEEMAAKVGLPRIARRIRWLSR